MAEKTLEIGIIGLGKFGLRMATTLASMGHTVIGIDMSDARVQLAEELLDTVYKADATSLSVLRSLHVQDLDWVVISVGEGVEQSLSPSRSTSRSWAAPRSGSRPPTRNTKRSCSACMWTGPSCPRWKPPSWPRTSCAIRACWT